MPRIRMLSAVNSLELAVILGFFAVVGESQLAFSQLKVKGLVYEHIVLDMRKPEHLGGGHGLSARLAH